MLVAAADGSTRLPVVRVAAGELGAETGSAVLDEAERWGLLTVAAGRLEFRHPLVRSAVYQAAGPVPPAARSTARWPPP